MANPGRNSENELITTGQAAEILGIKAASLYAYVSRGLLRKMGTNDQRQSLFARKEVEKLQARGRGPGATQALAQGAMS